MSSVIPGIPPCPPSVSPLALLTTSSSSSSTPPSPPKRKLFTEIDLEVWPRSEAYHHFTDTILRLVYAVRGKRNEDDCEESEAVKQLVEFLRQAHGWIEEVPLDTGPQRFGNKAFRVWVARFEAAIPELNAALLSGIDPSLAASLSPELSFHLLTSLGSPARLDFGTGHELSFLAYLTVLFRLGVLQSDRDEQAAVLRVFVAYVECVREAQRVFKLEPAGSKGVWGLDDHLHLVYLFGASQLINHPTLRPSSLLNRTILTPALCSSYLFPSSLSHIHLLKSGPFTEHSPLLHQILSTVPNFSKVTKGLWEMYKVEVLGKVPVVQHFKFGKGLGWKDWESGEELPSTGDGRDDDAEQEQEAAAAGSGPLGMEGPLIAPAPWASSSSSSSPSTSSSVPTIRPHASSSHSSLRTSISTSTSSTTSSSFSRRQNPASFPVPPSGRHTFSPPTLFPPRRSFPTSTTFPGQRGPATTAKETLADQGGAAASSSVFGVLPKATLPSLSSSSSSSSFSSRSSRAAGTEGHIGDQAGMKAPWA
ncbi:hypothetical protein JCM11641_005638 [Rhodosporidiobolus odoratus]